ncbi:MAG: carbohydrate binding family 9 domain-containing protein [Bacteroidetes bacterium]|nr:carbohydrate binding family 9 domain-containing protein [Bacteroidota bacterium]
MTLKRTSLALIFLLVSACALGQDTTFFRPNPHRRGLKAVKITGNIKVDGVLDEPQWSLTEGASDFIQVEPYQGRPSKFVTVVKVLYNQKYMYLGIICKDPQGKKAIMATDFMRDFDHLRHDLVSLQFDTFDDLRNAMVFSTNAYGVQRDLLSFDDLYFDIDWDGLWNVRTTRSDSGWVAEMAIPWKTFRYPKNKDSVQNWGFNMYRNRRATNELSAFSPFPRVFGATHMDYAGILTNLQPPPPSPNIIVDPYVLASEDHYTNFGNSEPPHTSSLKYGGDLKWAITPNAVLDLTANTDFAQADVEQQVNNTTRFNVFFPEKRQFFLENASLFGEQVMMNADQAGGSMHYQPFNSRTIGLDTSGNPIPIVGGGRFVYRSSSVNYGAMAIRQQGYNGGAATNFFVGRFSQNFGGQDHIGGLVTLKEQPGAANIESTLDGFFRFNESNSIKAIVTQSSTTNTGAKGFAGVVQYFNNTNSHEIWWTESLITKDFDPQMGFVSRSDVIATTPGINYFYRGKLLPFKSFLLAYGPGILPELYYTASTGRFSEADLPVFPVWFNFKDGGFFGYGVQWTWQYLTTAFSPLNVTIDPGNYHYFNQQVYFSTDPSKMLNAVITFSAGSYFNGRLIGGDYKVQFAPIPYISFMGEFNTNHFENVGVNNTTATVNLYILQGRFALNPRVQFTGIYQKNSLNNSNAYNLRFAWEFSPLSYIYFIYNRGVNSQLTTAPAIAQTEDHIIFKVSYLQQF